VTGEASAAPLRPAVEWVTAIAAAELTDGSPIILIGAADGTVLCHDVRTGAPVGDVVYPHGQSVDEIRPVRLPDGRTILAVDTGRIKCFDATTGDLISTSGYAPDSKAVPAYTLSIGPSAASKHGFIDVLDQVSYPPCRGVRVVLRHPAGIRCRCS
jgi:WD40 repeat protein